MEMLHAPRPHVYFEVEKVIGISSDGSYQVQWAPAWVSKFHLVGCEHLIQKFLQQQQSEKLGVQETELETPPHPQDFEIPPTQNSTVFSEEQSCENTYRKYSETWSQDDNKPKPVEDNFTEYYQHHAENEHIQGAISLESCQWKSTSALLGDTNNVNSEKLLVQSNNDDLPQRTVDVSVKIEEEVDDIDETSCPSALLLHGESALPTEVYTAPTTDTTTDTSSGVVTEFQRDAIGNSFEGKVSGIHVHHQADAFTRKKFICSFCQKDCVDRTQLKIHLRVHTGERPHVCTYCQKGFTQLGNLKVHLLTHTGEKPFTCNFCGRPFSVKCNLVKHMEVHTGAKRHSCDICGKTFSDLRQQKKHTEKCSSTEKHS